jgi:hypothetical protein
MTLRGREVDEPAVGDEVDARPAVERELLDERPRSRVSVASDFRPGMSISTLK